jgi:drug/metabolite transporter (DMT)-like permease
MKSGSAQGVFAMFVAVAAFAFMDALLKLFAAHYPPLQVAAIRAAASIPFVLLPIALRGSWSVLRLRRPGLHLLRGLLGVFMLSTFVFALGQASMASVYSIYMAAPLLIAAMAALWLGERVDRGRWLAIVLGLLGVLIILQPRPGGLAFWAGIAAALSALAYALAAITARLLTRSDSSPAIVLSFLVVILVVAGAFSLPGWVPIQHVHTWWIVAVGALGAVGQHYITEAFRHAPAAVVAPIEYTALLWGIGIDWVAWALIPNVTVLGGATLVVAAGCYVAWRERLGV